MRSTQVRLREPHNSRVARTVGTASRCGIPLLLLLSGHLFSGDEGFSWAAEAARTTISIDQVVTGMRTLSNAFAPPHTFRLAYRQEVDSHRPDGSLSRSHWTEADYARKRGMIRVQVRQSAPSQPGEVISFTVFWKDGICAERRRDGLTLMGFLAGQAMGYFFYTDALFIDAYHELDWGNAQRRKEAGGRTPSEAMVVALPRMIEANRDKYRLLPVSEVVDGSPCHVLEWPGRDRVWVDPTHGFLMRKRQFFDAGTLLAEWSNSDLRKCENGIWLPTNLLETNRLGTGAPKEHQGKLRSTKRTTLQSIDFADLPDTFFDVEVPKEETIIVNDSVRKITYFKHPEGSDPVGNAIQDAGGVSPRGWRNYLIPVLLVHGIACGLLGIWWLSRCLKRGS